MARPKKNDVEPISKPELQNALARLRIAFESIEDVCKGMRDGEVIYVSYLKSLERGIDRLEAVAPELRTSLSLHRAGHPKKPLASMDVAASRNRRIKRDVERN